MRIRDLIYQTNVKRKRIAMIACACKWAVRFCVVTISASIGVVIGALIAPKSGEKLRSDLKKGIAKSVDAIETVVHDTINN